MNYFNNFIIVDDDRINNKLCRKIIEKIYPNAGLIDFTDPQEGFNYLAHDFAVQSSDTRAVLLLDIIMPVMNAWEFLEQFETLSDEVKDRIKIFILSSSVDKNDMAKAKANKYVEYYLIKPLTDETIHLIVHMLHKKLGLSDR